MDGEFLLFKSKEELDQPFLNSLGGTMLLARSVMNGSALTLKDLPTILTTELETAKGKATFSLRLINIPPRTGRDLFRDCKNYLKSKGRPSRYVGNEREPAQAVLLHDAGLLDPKSGCELTVIAQKTGPWIGRTVAAQDIKSYTVRDMEKPVRDTTVGLLPPKLAQILLNFGEHLVTVKNQKPAAKMLTVFDPFCGTGVVPMEAMLRSWNVLGSDVSQKAVNGTTKNIEWLRKTYKVLKKDADAEIWKQDAVKPFELKEKPDMIVTEGTLGPPLEMRATVKDAEKLRTQADDLTAAFLLNCKATLPGVPVVMTLPVWYAQKKQIPLERVWASAEKAGFRPVLPPETIGSIPGRTSLLYRRPDQFVGREIVLLLPSL